MYVYLCTYVGTPSVFALIPKPWFGFNTGQVREDQRAQDVYTFAESELKRPSILRLFKDVYQWG